MEKLRSIRDVSHEKDGSCLDANIGPIHPYISIQTVMKGEEEKMIRPGLEPGAFCVLDRCDNQLRHRTASMDEDELSKHVHLL